jgi:hypothetical protein
MLLCGVADPCGRVERHEFAEACPRYPPASHTYSRTSSSIQQSRGFCGCGMGYFPLGERLEEIGLDRAILDQEIVPNPP